MHSLSVFFFFFQSSPHYAYATPYTITLWKNDYLNFNASSAEMEIEAEEGT